MARPSFRSWPVLPGLFLILTPCHPSRGADDLFPPLAAIKPDRPRLLLRPKPTRMAVPLADLRDTPQDADFKAMLDRLRGQQDDAAAQAMVWLLTKDDAAADRAVKRMRAYRFPGTGKVDTFKVHYPLLEFSLAYDWLHDCPAFPKAVRDEVRANVLPLAKEGLKLGDDHVFHNYVWMSDGGVALWALATAGEDAASDEVYNQVRQQFNARLFPAMQYLDGLPGEPMGYWAQYNFTVSVLVALAAQSATETAVVAPIQKAHDDWFNRNLETLVHGTLPDLWFVPWGDLQHGSHGGVTQEMAGIIDAATWASGSADGRWMSRWIAGKRGLARFYGPQAVYYMLYTRRLPAGPTPEHPALSWLAGNKQGGQLVARSGWGDGDTVVGFRCADFLGNHHHYDQGGFWVYRRGLLAVDPPVYKKVGGPQQPTDVHCTLLIGGKGQRPIDRAQSFTTLEKFKQNLTAGKRTDTGDMTFWHDAGPWAAAAGQYAQAYDVPELQSCVRQLLFVRPGTVVVVDRLAAAPGKELPEVQWLIQLPDKPKDAADAGLSATNGKAWVRCRPVLPGGAKPAVAETPVGTQRAAFAYAGKAEVVLVHVVDVGDGTEPTAASPAVKAERTAKGIQVTVGGEIYEFDAAAPYAVSARKS